MKALKKTPRRQVVLVLGQHRKGMSVATRVLSLLGVDFVSRTLAAFRLGCAPTIQFPESARAALALQAGET